MKSKCVQPYCWVHLMFVMTVFSLSSCQKGDVVSNTNPHNLLYSIEWGGENQKIGFHAATDEEGDIFDRGFTRFYIDNGYLYIYDSEKYKISKFEPPNILVDEMPLVLLSVQGMVVRDNKVYLLDKIGNLNLIDFDKKDVIYKKKFIDTGGFQDSCHCFFHAA